MDNRSPKLQAFLDSVPVSSRAREDKYAIPKTSLQISSAVIPDKGIECHRIHPDSYQDESGNLIRLGQQ